MEMGDQYGLPDLRRFLARGTHFPDTPQPSEPCFTHTHRNMAPLAPYHEAFMVSNGMAVPSSLIRFGHDHFAGASATTTAIAASASSAAASGPCAALFGVEMESSGIGWSLGNIEGGNSRWPRQETLTLLDIRSRLDSKFKEANQKGPLWDEVSRIMAEEHGYQRSGKKCREKFENLYKYYKKTKEGKAGRQDGKNYRFFRQLEALYGETSNQSSLLETNLAQRTLLCQTPNNTMNQENQEFLQEQKLSESLTFSNASEFETSSSENNDDDLSAIAFMMKQSMVEKQKSINESGSSSRVKKGWKTKVKDFVESQMKKLIDSQDMWMERMLKAIDDKERERVSKEEEWRRQEAARFDKEHEFWAKERSWVEARDAALLDVLKKFTAGKGLEVSSSAEAPVITETHSHNKNQQDAINTNRWTEHEVSSLIQLRKSFESRFQDAGYSKESLWEEIEAKMVGLGYERDAVECKEKWDNMQMYFNMTTECYKKRKEDFRSSNYFQLLDSCDGQENNTNTVKQRDSPSNSYVGTHQQLHDTNSFQIAVHQGDQRLWDRYGLKLGKGKNQQI
ncbi:PREDICTED: trihelix transcription factor PTL [Theobroma cacao]|uniref:Trihelix transcription factor PTL n=1 Tax=Theobroma cacao TaxID=3641 RepID=A0AB32X2K9_THECC|nr:PREDICTED: trihelix transcription factor PTL [Theobroma cacao]